MVGQAARRSGPTQRARSHRVGPERTELFEPESDDDDSLLVDGNPLEDIKAIGARDKWFDPEPRGPEIPSIRVVMKDGKFFKNTLTSRAVLAPPHTGHPQK